jgi:transcriptional regulator with XRE-family HTH domain
MPTTPKPHPYAGFANLRAYLDDRLSKKRILQTDLADSLSMRRSYISGIYQGDFVPSIERCDAIARFFGDDTHLVRVLAGREAPTIVSSPQMLTIFELASGLTNAQRDQVIEFIKALSGGA